MIDESKLSKTLWYLNGIVQDFDNEERDPDDPDYEDNAELIESFRAAIAVLKEPGRAIRTINDDRLDKPRTIADVTERGFYLGTIARGGPSDPPLRTIFLKDAVLDPGWLYLGEFLAFHVLRKSMYEATTVLQKLDWEAS